MSPEKKRRKAEEAVHTRFVNRLAFEEFDLPRPVTPRRGPDPFADRTPATASGDKASHSRPPLSRPKFKVRGEHPNTGLTGNSPSFATAGSKIQGYTVVWDGGSLLTDPVLGNPAVVRSALDSSGTLQSTMPDPDQLRSFGTIGRGGRAGKDD